MSKKTSRPAQTGFSRVYIIEGRARPDHEPRYQSHMVTEGLSQSFGDIERIEIPSDKVYGQFEEVGIIRGSQERATTTLTGRYASDIKSLMLELAKRGCPVDIHINFGTCTTPTDHNQYDKKIILENAYLTSYETEALGTLGSDGRAKIDESVEVSAESIIETTEMSWASVANDLITVPINDIIFTGNANCGDCPDSDDGCTKILSVTDAAGGSPSTPPDIVYSLDKADSWIAHDIDTLTSAQDASGVAVVGDYIVVVSEDIESLHYLLLSDLDETSDPVWLSATTGFVSGSPGNAIKSVGRLGFIAADAGVVYSVGTNPQAGVTVVEDGTITSEDLNDVHALNDNFAVAVGANSAIIKTENRTTWSLITPPVAGVVFNAVCLKTELEWFIAAANGNLYYTTDGGTNWTAKPFVGSGAGSVTAIAFSGNGNIMTITHTNSDGDGVVHLSTNGGFDFIVLPQGAGLSMPTNTGFNAIAICPFDSDFVIAAGADNTDGIIVVGEAARQ